MIFIIYLVIVFFIGLEIAIHSCNKKKIISAAKKEGWTNIKVSWTPFTARVYWPLSLFHKYERQYSVSYLDENGKPQKDYCKTSFFTDIYWRDK